MYLRWWASVVVLLLVPFARSQELNQFALASQSDWSAKKGMFILLDNRHAGRPSALETLKLTVALGDGNAWSVRSIEERFEYDKPYRVRLDYTGALAKVFINDEPREEFATGFAADGSRIFAFDNPEWARRPAAYLIRQQKLTVSSGERSVELNASSEFDVRRHLFNPGSAQTADLKLGDSFSVEAWFEIQPAPDMRSLSPLVDRYGQVSFANWDGKITSDDQLRAVRQQEEARLVEWEKTLPEQDRFGGRLDLGWREPATGFFRIVERSGKWWLVSPEGNPTFFTGMGNAPATTWEATPVSRREFIFESLPPQTGNLSDAWAAGHWGDDKIRYLAPQAVNLALWHGDNWREAETQHAIRRVRAWGFSGMGKWTSIAEQTRLPVLLRDGVPSLAGHPDTFDPEVRQAFREVLRKQIAGHENDPWIIGWSLGNEMDESFSAEEVRRILSREEAVPAAKREMASFALNKLFEGNLERMAKAWRATGATLEEICHQRLTPRRQDIEPLRMFLADQYFAFVYQTVKELAPNHLYFGHWILPSFWHNENDWKHMAPHCDVIGFDLYEQDFADARTQKAIRETRKPVFCGEFAFPPFWNGERGHGRFRTAVADETESGDRYQKWVLAAARNPWCIGVSVFQYRDQPVTGRGPAGNASPSAVQGENYAFGMIDITNSPRWPLLERVREANLTAPLVRAGLKH